MKARLTTKIGLFVLPAFRTYGLFLFLRAVKLCAHLLRGIVSLRALLSFIGEPHTAQCVTPLEKRIKFFSMSNIDSHYTGDATKV